MVGALLRKFRVPPWSQAAPCATKTQSCESCDLCDGSLGYLAAATRCALCQADSKLSPASSRAVEVAAAYRRHECASAAAVTHRVTLKHIRAQTLAPRVRLRAPPG